MQFTIECASCKMTYRINGKKGDTGTQECTTPGCGKKITWEIKSEKGNDVSFETQD